MSSPALSVIAKAPASIDLSGSWHLRLDRADAGVREAWFRSVSGDAFNLPGSLPERGIGDPVTLHTRWTGSIFDRAYFTEERYAAYRQPGNIKVPFWLQPETYYAGAAWYQRDIEIPAEWSTRRVVLSLERPHWQTRVWLDDREIGANDSLSTAHEYDLGTGLTAGRHRLSIRVDNGCVVDIGENSHSITDHTQGNWNGIVGRIELRATATTWIETVEVFPSVASRSVRLQGRIGRTGDVASVREVRFEVTRLNSSAGRPAVTATAPVSDDGTFTATIALGADAPLWDEFSPALHRLTVRLENGETKDVVFGLREIGADGSQLTINGRKLFIRGTLECAIFPKTGHPPLDVAAWKHVIEVARSYGLNSLRFHSWCPPEAAFQAGDELGFYFQIEAASWPNQSTTLGDGKPVDAWLEHESVRILRAYGNHPCFVLMASGNEPGNEPGREKERDAYLSAWVKRRKAEDPRRLFTSGAGWPQLPENQYHVTSDPRIQQWGDGLKSRINAKAPETMTDYRDYIAKRAVPVVSHEIGQWCVFPDFSEMPKYTGYLKPRNFEIFRETLAAHGLSAKAAAFVQASGKLQALCYKEDIESALRTPGMGGFQLLDLHDFPGQGTALVGVLNPFWESKGYISGEEYRRFCSSTVPLARLKQRVFTQDQTLVADCEVAHFGPTPLAHAVAQWRLVNDAGKTVANGSFAARDIPVGAGNVLGRVSVPLATIPAPARYKLVVAIEGASAVNDWDVWVYPTAPQESVAANVVVTSDVADACAALEKGDTVLLTLPSARVSNPGPEPVALGFSSIFWNTAWTKRQAPTTLGILCDPKHPALAAFPTDSHSNWQWWYVISHGAALRLDGLPSQLEPVVTIIDDWFTSRRLGLVVEARVGKGRLIATGLDLKHPDNPVTRQLRASLLQYAAKPAPATLSVLTTEQVRGWVQ